ncbi:MAG: PP2C family protein-serine/threonine phosphatase [Nocardioides sp.]
MVLERWAQLVADERSEAFLAALRERLQHQSQVPPLPPGWHVESSMIPSDGFEYGGDFFVADVTDDALQMVLVDACGHGPAAMPDAVQFAGALGALVDALPVEQVMTALNDYVLHRCRVDSFVTAVHVNLRLADGSYCIRSAGHPPVLRWCAGRREWVVDGARGAALGLTDHPAMEDTHGVLEPGDALMFYTDGVVEARGADIDDGIDALRVIARDVVAPGFRGAPARILADVPRGEDDRAVLILRREPAGEPDTGAAGSPPPLSTP